MTDNTGLAGAMNEPSDQKSGAPTSGAQIQVQVNREFKERDVMKRSQELGISYINLSKIPINPELLYLVTPDDARNGLLLPFFRIGKKLRVAVCDPKKPETVNILDGLTQRGYILNLNLTSQESLDDALKLYLTEQYKIEKKIENVIRDEDIKAYEEEIKNLYALKDKIGTMTSEEALNILNVGALKTGASDLHFQQEEYQVIVRFRIDGLLQEIFRLDTHVFTNIANQLKYKAKMKLNITNVPQDGRYYFVVNQRKIDVRVNSIPTEFGESFVCRFLDSNKKFSTFDQLGFGGHNTDPIKETLGLSHGMILVTGPTGSGKTTTLYSMLTKYNTPEKKIITLEDPVEYHLENVTQSQINQKREYTFASGLRAILRQDPDVIMIGEIRDLETAEAAAQAALTGHVVLSTLHTNSAIETVPRLVNMGLPEFIIAPSLTTVIAQRLVRRICDHCHKETEITTAEMTELETAIREINTINPSINAAIPDSLKQVSGCDLCSHTGYKGQIGIIEIINLDNDLKDLILAKQSLHVLFEAARKKKMLTMKEDGILKVMQGVTTLEEVHRVTKVI